jgi:hypothetical protein
MSERRRWLKEQASLAAERVALAARVEELEAERDDLWNKLGEAMAEWNTAEARIARAVAAVADAEYAPHGSNDAAPWGALRAILRGEDTPETP